MSVCVNKYLVRIDEATNAKIFGIAMRSKVYASLSPELMKSIVELSNGKIYPIECINEIVLKAEIFYDKALKELEKALKTAVIRKLESETEFRDERVITLERKDVSLYEYIIAIEEAKKQEQEEKMRIAIKDKMIEFVEKHTEKHSLGYDALFSLFLLKIYAHKYMKELRFRYTEEDLRKLQSLDIKHEIIQFQNEIINNLENEVKRLKNKIEELESGAESDENDE